MNYEEMNEKYGCTVENFIKDTETEYSICREERQYAVLLYSILRFYRKPEMRSGKVERIFTVCGIPKEAKIKKVFYEATFMRDFFERNRRLVLGKGEDGKMPGILIQKKFTRKRKSMDRNDAFNYRLIEYVHKGKVEDYKDEDLEYGDKDLKYKDKDLKYNLGRYVPHALLSKDEKFTIKCMMEAKPDIAVLYEKNDTEYLLFLECKFESGESSYSNKGKSTKKKQSEIQWMIADFLCRTYLKGKAEVSESMEKKKSSCLVRFVREYGEKTEEKEKTEKEIKISDLVNLNRKEIFHEEETTV